MASKVYFTSQITPLQVLKLFELSGKALPGNVAIKVHSGEPGNQNFIQPAFWKPTVDRVGGTLVECNTAYEGGRNTTERHRATFQKHGWSDLYAMDILDAQGPDLELANPGGKRIQKTFVGKDIQNYDSVLVLSHFKGHPMGGFGGALKQLSIGFASSAGKGYIHGVGDPAHFWDREQDAFLEAMADAAWAVADYFKGNALYINVMKNLSVDCDCCDVAEDPCMADIGILMSEDPVAIDQACVDLIYASSDRGRDHMVERIESRHGLVTLAASEALGTGTREYELINID